MNGAELAVAGAAGIGAAWGWLGGGLGSRRWRPDGFAAAVVASAALLAEVDALGGPGAVVAAVLAALGTAGARVAVVWSLARRYGRAPWKGA